MMLPVVSLGAPATEYVEKPKALATDQGIRHGIFIESRPVAGHDPKLGFSDAPIGFVKTTGRHLISDVADQLAVQ